jgi:replicative DNA helicase
MVTIEDLKLPPHNVEAEKGVLGAIFVDPEVIYIYDGLNLKPDDFYLKEHQYIYESVYRLRNDKKTIDIVTVSDQLKKDGKLDLV